jgi:NFU1 iron-sulfur cluster scaffold homolog, mitochondrial
MGNDNHQDLTVKIQQLIEHNIQPYAESHSGIITFVRFENGVVYVRMKGACEHCSASFITLKAKVERALRKEFIEVQKVELQE